MNRKFGEMLLERQNVSGSLLCAGLDATEASASEILGGTCRWMDHQNFLCRIVDKVHPYVCAFKPNLAFYGASGHDGMEFLLDVVSHIRSIDKNIPIIGDGKRTDIGNTNDAYAAELFEHFGFDAITVNPYFGGEALSSFLNPKYGGKGIFVLCRTSNPSAGEFQDRLILIEPGVRTEMEKFLGREVHEDHIALYQYVAYRASAHWNENGNVGLVVGATYPDELSKIRRLIGGAMPVLMPGIGKQGGDMKLAMDANENGIVIVNASGAIVNASKKADFDDAAGYAAMKLRDQINNCR